MQYDILVLRAILRLSRHRRSVDVASLTLRVPEEGGEPALRNALRRLETQGLAVREQDRARLTMMGLAVAVASLPSHKRSSVPHRVRRAA